MIARLAGKAGPALPVVTALALVMLIVAACAGPKGPARPAEGDTAANQSIEIEQAQRNITRAQSPGEEPHAPVAALDSEMTDPGSDAPPAAAAKTTQPPINDDPHQLMGLAPQAVNRLLGPPSLLRTEAPAEVWQYKAEDCVLDIYLYAEEQMPDRSSVTYYEIRRSDTSKRGVRACFGDIIQSWNNASGEAP